MRAASCSSARRTSRTTTSRWCRTWARSAKVAVSNELSSRSLQSSGPPVACAAGPVDADPDELALRLRDLLGGLAEQGDRGAPGDQPAEVRREAAVEPEVERAGCVAGRERGPAAQVDDPLAGLDATAQLGGVGDRRQGEVGLGGAGGVGRTHVGVVGRPRAEAGQQLLDVRLLVLGEDRVGLLLAADGGGASRRTGWPSRRSRSRGSGRPPASSGSRSASRCADACWWRTRSSVCSGPRRSGRPVAPYSREPPEKTPTERSSSSPVSVRA